jgi:alpha-glucosidase
VLLLTLRGTPFLFQGEELGLLDAPIPSDRKVDPGGRDGCRAPIPWSSDGDHGWPVTDGREPWLPLPPESAFRNHEDQRKDASSVLHLYRRLIVVRRGAPALSSGDFDLLELREGLLGFRRTAGNDVWIVIVNFTGQALDHVDGLPMGVGWRVVVSSNGDGEGATFDGSVGADQAVVLTR